MNVEISHEEYKDLLDLLYMAHWVLKAHKTEEDPRSAKYEKVIQKFYSRAEEMGHADMIEYDREIGEFFPTWDFEETTEAWDFIEEFTDDTFWDELTDRLTQRDLERQEGGYEKIRGLSLTERFELEAPFIERYEEEFSENGIERLEIVERFDVEGVKPKTSD